MKFPGDNSLPTGFKETVGFPVELSIFLVNLSLFNRTPGIKAAGETE